jgi:hypothetical protein
LDFLSFLEEGMKKTNVFFMKLLVIIVLLGFSGTSSAYDLSKWTSKPVEWVKHVAQWFGYDDKDENETEASSSETTVKSAEVPVMNEESQKKESTYTVSITKDISNQIDSDLYNIKDTFSLSNETPDYNIRISGPFQNTSIDIYGWHEDTVNLLAVTENNYDQEATSTFQQYLSSYNTRNNNVAARFSYHLPFLGGLHQGMTPSVNIESSYRFESSQPSYTAMSGLPEATDYRWKTGITYRGKNFINLPISPVAINWGIGYDYKIASDNYGSLENGYEAHKNTHSGSIFAGSYWYNLKLYTMFMYLYDSESRGSMTILNATYSPSLRWTYGIKANFYNSKKEGNGKGINSNPEQVSFTATYRWD